MRAFATGATAITLHACASDSTISVTAPSSGTRCALTATTDLPTASPTGSSGALTIGVNRECSWTVSADVEWIAFGAPTSGQGPVTLPFTVAPNAAVQPRRGRVAVNDQQVEIAQGAAPCRFSLDREQQTFAPAGGIETVRVSAQPGCGWTAVSHDSWVVMASATSGDGAGAVSVSVQPNDRPQPREGAATIAGLMYRVSQAAAAVTPPVPPGPVPPVPPGTPTPPSPGPVPPTPTPPTPTPPTPAPPTPAPPSPAPPTPAPPAPAPTPPTPAPPTTVVIEGKVSDVQGNCPAVTFAVDKRTVRTTAQTGITGGNCQHIQDKAKVEVRGTVSAGDIVVASSITIVEKAEKSDEDNLESGSMGLR